MEKHILICINRRHNPRQPSCAARGSESLADALEARLREAQLQLPLERMKCLGCCDEGPNLRLAPNGPMFHHLREQDLPELMNQIRRFLADDL